MVVDGKDLTAIFTRVDGLKATIATLKAVRALAVLLHPTCFASLSATPSPGPLVGAIYMPHTPCPATGHRGPPCMHAAACSTIQTESSGVPGPWGDRFFFWVVLRLRGPALIIPILRPYLSVGVGAGRVLRAPPGGVFWRRRAAQAHTSHSEARVPPTLRLSLRSAARSRVTPPPRLRGPGQTTFLLPSSRLPPRRRRRRFRGPTQH